MSEEMYNKIIFDYENTMNDVIQIASDNELDAYNVISILKKHNIISKRNDVRGYESYTQSEEYQTKVTQKLKK